MKLQSVQVYAEWNEKTYPAFADPTEDWNGFAIPCFSKEVAQEVVKDQNELAMANPNAPLEVMTWDSGNIAIINVHPDGEIETITPVSTEHGDLYYIGNSWTWSIVEE